MTAKKTRLTIDEKAFIKDNAHKMTDAELAQYLKRNIVTITRNRKALGIQKGAQGKIIEIDTSEDEATFDRLSNEDQRKTMEHQIRSSSRYKELQHLFTPEELERYVRKWSSYTVQFRADVMATEETQIDQLVQYEILIDRNLSDRQWANNELHRLEKVLNKLEDESEEIRSIDRIFKVEAQLGSIRGSQPNRTTEFIKLQEKHASILKDLKATRVQRIRDVESSKHNFMDWVKMMMDKEYQEREARNMELVRIAAQQEYKKLGEYHEFMDETVDRMIINEDTVMWGDKNE